MRLLSVALHEKAEPPALPRGSALQKVATSGRAGAVGDAVRAMDESAGAEKAGPENADARPCCFKLPLANLLIYRATRANSPGCMRGGAAELA